MQGMSASPSPARPPVTDSPWFWVAVFCAAGVMFLLAIWPQYAARQRRLEMQFRARQEILERQAAGETAARAPGDEGDAAPPPAGQLLIPLWPLVLVVATLCALAATLLWRTRGRAASVGQPGPEESR